MATDNAGNDDTRQRRLRRRPDGAHHRAFSWPGAAATGWWNASTGAPTATFACSIDTSGVASCSGAFTFGEGADQSTTGTTTDNAGNSASADVTGIDVDLTGPVNVVFTGGGLVDGGQYAYLFVPAGPTGCASSDAGGGAGGEPAGPETASLDAQPVGPAGTKRYAYWPPSTSPPPVNTTFTGPVRSTSIPVTSADAEFPALSVDVPVVDWSAPSPKVNAPLQLATPEVSSEHANVAVGAPVEAFHQPERPAPGQLKARSWAPSGRRRSPR